MSQPIIKIESLTKTYRLYTKPMYRFLDMFGLLRQRPGAYSEHHALHEIDLEIHKGEKVAFIGRNGAGKSTLLKLISGVIEPTEGKLNVQGKIHALLQIGTGFHPDFTGRENVYSYLAQLGVVGKDAEEKLDEIVDFAELEEYINQPVKTYSSGMQARLMFATSTAIAPDILILDEILGVGDAYFAQKSMQYMKKLCSGEGTTLLLVTHDIYSALKICDRFVWLDHGRILLDDVGKIAVNRYEESIRDQEERRLRLKHIEDIKKNIDGAKEMGQDIVFGQIRIENAVPVENDLPISKIIFYCGKKKVVSVYPADESKKDNKAFLDLETGNWSQICVIDGKPARCVSRSGSVFYKAGFSLAASGILEAMEKGNLTATIEFKDTSKQPFLIELFFPDGVKKSKGFIGNEGRNSWICKTVHFTETAQVDSGAGQRTRFGNRKFYINDVDFQDFQGTSKHLFKVGAPLRVIMNYVVSDQNFDETVIVHINFIREGVRVARFVLNEFHVDYAERPQGQIVLHLDRIAMGPGKYLVNIVVWRSVMMESGGQPFFSINENVLDHHTRAYEVLILPTDNMLIDDCACLLPCKWEVRGDFVQEGIYGLDVK